MKVASAIKNQFSIQNSRVQSEQAKLGNPKETFQRSENSPLLESFCHLAKSHSLSQVINSQLAYGIQDEIKTTGALSFRAISVQSRPEQAARMLAHHWAELPAGSITSPQPSVENFSGRSIRQLADHIAQDVNCYRDANAEESRRIDDTLDEMLSYLSLSASNGSVYTVKMPDPDDSERQLATTLYFNQDTREGLAVLTATPKSSQFWLYGDSQCSKTGQSCQWVHPGDSH